jgi:hypothetical protein
LDPQQDVLLSVVQNLIQSSVVPLLLALELLFELGLLLDFFLSRAQVALQVYQVIFLGQLMDPLLQPGALFHQVLNRLV